MSDIPITGVAAQGGRNRNGDADLSDPPGERRFRALVENGAEGVVLLSADGRILFASRSLERMFDRSRDEMVSRLGMDWVEPPDVARLAAMFTELVRVPDHTASAELRVRSGDGSLRWVDATGKNLLHDPDVQAVVITVRDVTERRGVEDELRRVASIVDSSGDAIIGESLSGLVTSWNAAAERMYGYTAAEMIGAHIAQLASPELNAEWDQIMARLVRGESVEDHETVRLRRDGSVIHVSLTASPIHDSTGAVVGASVIARDITEQQRARDALVASEDNYRRLFEQNPVPMWVYDLHTLRFLSVNQAAVRHYGYSAEEFMAMTLEDIRPREDVPDLLDAVAGGERRDVWRHRKKDGSIIDVDVQSHPLRLNGVPARLVIAADTTEHHRIEHELRKALQAEREGAQRLRALDEMKNSFLNAVSHELRTPLSSVLGSALTLERLGLDLTITDQRDLLRAVVANARKLERMLSDLLDLDRLTRGVLQPRRSAIEVGEFIRSVVDNTQLGEQRPIEVETHPMVLRIDAPKVERIVENLLANAVKYSPAGTPIWVRVTRIPEGMLIVVEDAGPGVPEEARQAIFEPFRQGTNRSEHAPGVGIGLSLVARFAELHGGKAWVEERPGGGASFRVVLREPTAPRREDE